jgi:hypothetical protein
VILGFGSHIGLAGGGAIDSVSVSPPFFNPSLEQRATVVVKLKAPASAALSILDRDNYVIRSLPAVNLPAGESTLTWDGKDQKGVVVPNEAYSISLITEGSEGRDEYAPSRNFMREVSFPTPAYSIATGVFRYELNGPSRVHMQAGEAVLIESEGRRDGPVLKTVVDREPRVGGKLIEFWDGYDESRTVRIPTLKNFVAAIMAESLPPSTVITVGSRGEKFRQYAARTRVGHAPLFAKHEHPIEMPGMRHDGLTALDDFGPDVTMLLPGKRDEAGRVEVGTGSLSLKVEMPESESKLFVLPESTLDVFVDDKRIIRREGVPNPSTFSISGSDIPPGEHRLSVNWISTHGPTSAQLVRVIRVLPAEQAGK